MIKATIQNSPYCTEIRFPCSETELSKDFSDREIDTIELLLIKLYEKFNISDDTDWSKLKAIAPPIKRFRNLMSNQRT